MISASEGNSPFAERFKDEELKNYDQVRTSVGVLLRACSGNSKNRGEVGDDYLLSILGLPLWLSW